MWRRMDSLIVYLLVIPIICFLGLFVGLLIGWMAKEELKAGKRLFIFLQVLFLLLVGVFFFLDFDQVPYLIFIFGFPTGTLFYYGEKKKNVGYLIKRLLMTHWYILLIIIAIFGLRLIL